ATRATQTRGTAASPAGGPKPRDKGTRGGRPEASTTTTGPRQGNRPGGRGGTGRPAPARTAAPVKAAAVEEAPSAAPPLWFQLTTWILSLAGLGVSVYLTIAHYNTAVILACPASSTINCQKVTTSPEPMVFGLAFYLCLAVANSPGAWRINWPPLRWARVASMVAGILFVLYLIYAELFSIRAICLWCTSVHVITFILFVLIVFGAAAGYGTA